MFCLHLLKIFILRYFFLWYWLYIWISQSLKSHLVMWKFKSLLPLIHLTELFMLWKWYHSYVTIHKQKNPWLAPKIWGQLQHRISIQKIFIKALILWNLICPEHPLTLLIDFFKFAQAQQWYCHALYIILEWYDNWAISYGQTKFRKITV